jgi:UBX domain-containing protein 1
MDFEMIDKRDSDYTPKPIDPFSGGARKVGATAPPAQASADYSNGGSSTRIRFKLPDGQVLIITVNMTATVKDLKSYVRAKRPDFAHKTIKLELSFPAKALTDDQATVEAAGLKMAQVDVTVV